jgi:hypothetical protein
MVEPQPSKLMMPVRSWSAALFVGALHRDDVAHLFVRAMAFVPRISRGIRCTRRLGKPRARFRGNVTVGNGVLVAQRCCGTRMTGPHHQLTRRGALRRRPGESRAPQIVEVDPRSPHRHPGGASGGVEEIPAEPSTLLDRDPALGRKNESRCGSVESLRRSTDGMSDELEAGTCQRFVGRLKPQGRRRQLRAASAGGYSPDYETARVRHEWGTGQSPRAERYQGLPHQAGGVCQCRRERPFESPSRAVGPRLSRQPGDVDFLLSQAYT